MTESSLPHNRVRQARRAAKLSQVELAERVGVHRSAVAQWESVGGCHPTVENMARIAIATAVSFEWLATGRGRMKYQSDFLPGDEVPAVLLDYAAQGESEVRALAGLRRLDNPQIEAVVELIERLGKAHALKLKRKVPYSR